MEVLELISKESNVAQLVLRIGTDGTASASTQGISALAGGFPGLRVFRTARPIEPRVLERLLGPSVKSGALRELQLSLGHSIDSSTYSLEPARDLAFTFSDHVHTLGLSDFWWWTDRRHGGNSARRDGSNSDRRVYGPDSKSLVDWLDHFPAVRTIHLHPAKRPGRVLFAVDVMSRLKSKTLITDAWDNPAEFFELKRVANQHGVRLIPA